MEEADSVISITNFWLTKILSTLNLIFYCFILIPYIFDKNKTTYPRILSIQIILCGIIHSISYYIITLGDDIKQQDELFTKCSFQGSMQVIADIGLSSVLSIILIITNYIILEPESYGLRLKIYYTINAFVWVLAVSVSLSLNFGVNFIYTSKSRFCWLQKNAALGYYIAYVIFYIINLCFVLKIRKDLIALIEATNLLNVDFKKYFSKVRNYLISVIYTLVVYGFDISLLFISSDSQFFSIFSLIVHIGGITAKLLIVLLFVLNREMWKEIKLFYCCNQAPNELNDYKNIDIIRKSTVFELPS